MKKTYFQAISPDGFGIKPEIKAKTRAEAIKEFKEWLKMYEHRGYYFDMNQNRIPLAEIHISCSMAEYNARKKPIAYTAILKTELS